MESAVQLAGETNGRGWIRRRQYFVNPAFQWKCVLALALIVFLISSILSSVLYGLLHHQARMRVINPETYVAEVPLVVILSGAAFSLLAAGALGVWSVFLTHRVCGPLFVMDRLLTELAAGRIPRLRPLRRKDEFKDLYANFSRMVDSLRERREAEFRALTELLNAARSGLDAGEEGWNRTLESLIDQIETLRKRAADALGGG